METLDKHFRTLTKAVFQKHGFQQADLLARWREIAGERLASISRPERIRWPRGSEGAKQGGTLVVSARAGHALDVQYAGPQILERVNAYLGYGAVAALRVNVSSTLADPPKAKPAASPLPQVPGIADPALEAALARLGRAVGQRK